MTMQARDVMTKHVISVLPDVEVRAAAEEMISNGVSAVVVTDERGALIGILSEGDLLHRRELTTQIRHRSWWLKLFTSDQEVAADYVKSHSRKVRDVMTAKVIFVSPDTALSDIARLFDKHHIKRVPVVDKGRLVGVVSRSNLVQALANAAELLPPAESDSMLKREIDRRIEDQPWALRPFSIHVTRGNVDLQGLVYSDDERDAIRVAAENTPGVKSVINNLQIINGPLEFY